MKIEDLTYEEITEFNSFIKTEFIFSFDQDSFKFFGTMGDVNFNVSHESIDDHNIQLSVIKGFDVTQSLIELIFEELCCKRFHVLGLKEYNFNQYSHGTFLGKVEKLKYLYFSQLFVNKINEYLKGK